MQHVHFSDLGRRDYKEVWDLQEALLTSIVDRKLANRTLPSGAQHSPLHYLLFVEHPHVYTLGKSGEVSHLLATADELESIGATYYKINRGGDITYHGPGQLVGYPVFDLDHFFNDIHHYLRLLEESIIRTCADYGLPASRIQGLTGVWIDADRGAEARKICAFGVRCSRWVTMHGFAFNIHPDLAYFRRIVPCGITDRGVTSLEQELGRHVEVLEVKQRVLQHMQELFAFEAHHTAPEQIDWMRKS